MENNKYGWKPKQTFEQYYLFQLRKLKSITLNYYFDNLNENSSIEEISTDFDRTLDFISRYYKKPEETNKTEEYIKQESALKSLKEMPRKVGFLPIDLKPTENKILVLDINYLVSEHKDKTVESVTKELESLYGCKVLLIDGSRMNTQGLSNNYSPAYFI